MWWRWQAAKNKFATQPGDVPVMLLPNVRGGLCTAIPMDVPLAQTPARSCGLKVSFRDFCILQLTPYCRSKPYRPA